MKRKILSLILVLMLLPVASVFVACNKDKGYNLNNLSKDYEKIELENNNIAMIDDLILIDYSAYDNLNNSVNAVEPYTALKSYNYVLNNVLKFTCNYIEICSNNELQVPATVKNNVKSSLDAFKKSVKDVDVCVDSLGEIISVSDDVLDRSCISRYKNLLNTYETMLNRAIDFNNAVTDLYFGYILNDSNPNVFELSYDDFDANVIVNKFKSRISYQVGLLSQAYVEMYINGGSFAENIAEKEATFNLDAYNYISNINSINKNFDEQVAVEYSNNETNKVNFYNISIKAYNAQAILENEKEKVRVAFNNIEYKTVKNDMEASAYAKLCVEIIDANYELITTYNSILAEMLSLMGV